MYGLSTLQRCILVCKEYRLTSICMLCFQFDRYKSVKHSYINVFLKTKVIFYLKAVFLMNQKTPVFLQQIHIIYTRKCSKTFKIAGKDNSPCSSISNILLNVLCMFMIFHKQVGRYKLYKYTHNFWKTSKFLILQMNCLLLYVLVVPIDGMISFITQLNCYIRGYNTLKYI